MATFILTSDRLAHRENCPRIDGLGEDQWRAVSTATARDQVQFGYFTHCSDCLPVIPRFCCEDPSPLFDSRDASLTVVCLSCGEDIEPDMLEEMRQQEMIHYI